MAGGTPRSRCGWRREVGAARQGVAKMTRHGAPKSARCASVRTMGEPERRAVERYWEAFNTRDLSLLDDVIADDYVNDAALPGTPPGVAGQAQVMERLWTAFPDARFEIGSFGFSTIFVM